MSLTISLINKTLNATSYLWNFGDGATSTAANPSHTYASAGAYVVSLTASGPGGSRTFQKVAIVAGDDSLIEYLTTSDFDIIATDPGGDPIVLS